MATAENFQHRADMIAYGAVEATAALKRQWKRLRDEYIYFGTVLHQANRLVDDPEFQRLVAAHEVDASKLERMLAEMGRTCARIGTALEDEEQ